MTDATDPNERMKKRLALRARPADVKPVQPPAAKFGDRAMNDTVDGGAQTAKDGSGGVSGAPTVQAEVEVPSEARRPRPITMASPTTRAPAPMAVPNFDEGDDELKKKVAEIETNVDAITNDLQGPEDEPAKGLVSRVAALEGSKPDLSPVERRVAALEKRATAIEGNCGGMAADLHGTKGEEEKGLLHKVSELEESNDNMVNDLQGPDGKPEEGLVSRVAELERTSGQLIDNDNQVLATVYGSQDKKTKGLLGRVEALEQSATDRDEVEGFKSRVEEVERKTKELDGQKDGMLVELHGTEEKPETGLLQRVTALETLVSQQAELLKKLGDIPRQFATLCRNLFGDLSQPEVMADFMRRFSADGKTAPEGILVGLDSDIEEEGKRVDALEGVNAKVFGKNGRYVAVAADLLEATADRLILGLLNKNDLEDKEVIDFAEKLEDPSLLREYLEFVVSNHEYVREQVAYSMGEKLSDLSVNDANAKTTAKRQWVESRTKLITDRAQYYLENVAWDETQGGDA